MPMRKLFLLASFIVIVPVVFLLNVVFLIYLSTRTDHSMPNLFRSSSKTSVSFAALPSMQNMAKGEILSVDARIELIRQFFARYDSPLEPYAKNVIDAADNYGLDFRLIPAIAMQESNLCKKVPADSHNCWGFGIYGDKITKFDNYPQAIDTVTKTLAKQYKAKGLDTPEEIMSKYTPSSNGSWARSVTYFINVLR